MHVHRVGHNIAIALCLKDRFRYYFVCLCVCVCVCVAIALCLMHRYRCCCLCRYGCDHATVSPLLSCIAIAVAVCIAIAVAVCVAVAVAVCIAAPGMHRDRAARQWHIAMARTIMSTDAEPDGDEV